MQGTGLSTGTVPVEVKGTGSQLTTNINFIQNLRSRQQMLFRRAEMPHLLAGDINAISFFVVVSAIDVLGTMEDVTVTFVHTNATTLTALDTTSFSGAAAQRVFAPVTVKAGWITITFTNPFAYDGVSNLLVQVCMTTNSYVQAGLLAHGTSYHSQVVVLPSTSDNNPVGCAMLGGTADTKRPVVRFSGSSYAAANPINEFFSCACKDGFTGTLCETDIDEVYNSHKNAINYCIIVLEQQTIILIIIMFFVCSALRTRVSMAARVVRVA